MTTKSTPEYLEFRRLSYQQNRKEILAKLAVKRKQNPVKYILKDAKRRAKQKNLEFSLSEKDISIPDICPISLIKLQLNDRSLRQNSPSLDRIDNSKGYTPDNVRIISNRANAIKRDATVDEIERLLKYMRKELGNE